MFAFIVRRLFVGVAMLLAMTLVTFALFFAAPIDPVRFSCGKNCSPAQLEETRKSLGYDKGAVEQWVDFMKGIVNGRDYPDDPEMQAARPDLVVHCPAPCLGYSTYADKTVNEQIKDTFPVSFSVTIAALFFWLFGGVVIGTIAAVKRGTVIDRGILAAVLLVAAFPVFFTGTFLLRYIAIKWGWWPVPNYTPIAEGGVFEWAVNLVMPGLTLAGLYAAGYARITRAFVLESMSEDYVRTARAKGARERVVLYKHSLRAALTPLVTMTGVDFASVLGSAIITETVFNYPGLGKLSFSAFQNWDLPTLIGLVVLLASFVIIANTIVDILYAVIDPRVRVG